MIQVEASGVLFEGFTGVSVSTSMQSLTGAFNLNTLSVEQNLNTKISQINVSDGLPFPWKIGEQVSILVDGEQVLTGFIDDISAQYSGDSHSISVSGVDSTDDILKSTASEKVQFTTKISFEDLITKTLETNTPKTIKVINQVPGLTPFETSEIESPEVGGNLFDFFLQLARKKKVLLSTDGLGNLTIIRSSTDAVPDKLINNVKESNIQSASFSLSHKNRYGKYVVFSQGNMTAENASPGVVSADSIAGRRGESEDIEVRPSRVLNTVSAKTQNSEQCKELAEWQQNFARIDGYKYSCVVIGHIRPSGGIWKPNTLVFIKDIFAGLNSNMLINSVTYTQNSGKISTTALDFVSPDAYQIQANEPVTQVKSSEMAKNLKPTIEQINANRKSLGVALITQEEFDRIN